MINGSSNYVAYFHQYSSHDGMRVEEEQEAYLVECGLSLSFFLQAERGKMILIVFVISDLRLSTYFNVPLLCIHSCFLKYFLKHHKT